MLESRAFDPAPMAVAYSRAEAQLPTESDFNPWGDFPDAGTAWRNFGGLTLDEAYAKFCENPMYYQEDFMFMGGKAFAFYFPVVEKYLRSNAVHVSPTRIGGVLVEWADAEAGHEVGD